MSLCLTQIWVWWHWGLQAEQPERLCWQLCHFTFCCQLADCWPDPVDKRSARTPAAFLLALAHWLCAKLFRCSSGLQQEPIMAALEIALHALTGKHHIGLLCLGAVQIGLQLHA